MRNIAIIPARSGSKGLKDKNIKILNKKPMIQYTIESAIQSNMFDEIMVSTDSNLYAEIAVECGAKVPFLRSEKYSNDTASSWDVVKEVLYKYEKMGKKFDTVTLLQPTSPLRSKDDIINAYNLFREKEANTVVSVCEVDHSPLLCNTLNDDLCMDNFLDKNVVNSPRQKLGTYYRLNGAIYIVNVEFLKNNEYIYENKSYASVMSKENSIDVDDITDFKIAEALIK